MNHTKTLLEDHFPPPSVFKQPVSFFLNILVKLAMLLTMGILLSIIGYVLLRGVTFIKPEIFALQFTTENLSMTPAIINTLFVALIALLLAVPTGVGAAIYLIEYAKPGSKLVQVVRLTTETLSGIPSIVYGLFGYLFFVIALKWQQSILSGSFTLAIMILPLIMRTTEEALKSVPRSYREGSYALGAGKLRTITKVVLPSAVPGILAGTILGIGRIVGETAALIYTAGTVAGIPTSPFSSGRTLAVHMYALLSEGLYVDQAYATAVVLLIFVLLLNAASSLIASGLKKNRRTTDE